MIIINCKVSAGIAIFVLVLICFWTCTSIQAQTNMSLQPSDKFSIPTYDGIISFAVNGSYSKATFENGAWTFVNLHLNGSQTIASFQVSTQNSNMTIFSYRASNNTSFQSVRLRYEVEGQGQQILNLGLGPEQGNLSSSVAWSVIVNNNVFLAQGEGWTISHNGTMVINGASGNVSIVHYGFLGSFGNSLQNSNLPFYQQHSVAIAIIVAVAIVIVVAVVIKVRNAESPKKSVMAEDA